MGSELSDFNFLNSNHTSRAVLRLGHSPVLYLSPLVHTTPELVTTSQSLHLAVFVARCSSRWGPRC